MSYWCFSFFQCYLPQQLFFFLPQNGIWAQLFKLDSSTFKDHMFYESCFFILITYLNIIIIYYYMCSKDHITDVVPFTTQQICCFSEHKLSHVELRASCQALGNSEDRWQAVDNNSTPLHHGIKWRLKWNNWTCFPSSFSRLNPTHTNTHTYIDTPPPSLSLSILPHTLLLPI